MHGGRILCPGRCCIRPFCLGRLDDIVSVPILRTSERKSLKRCPQKWWWGWREGLVKKGMAAPPLWFGTGVHLALGLWYCGPGAKRGPHPAETWTNFCGSELTFLKDGRPDDEMVERYVNAQDLGRVMLEEYVKKYGRDEHKLYIQPEQTFSLDVPWSDRQGVYEYITGQLLVRYCGTYDGVWRHADLGWVILDEHKTAKAIDTSHLPMDDQGGSYWSMASMTLRANNLIGPKERLRGIEYNFLRKALPDTRPLDSEGYACNKPVKADYVAAIEAERAKMPGKVPGSSWIGPPLTGKETLAQLADITAKIEITVLGERSKVQPAVNFQREMIHRTAPERKAQLRRVQDEAVIAQVLRDGLLPIVKNPTRDCKWDCDFYAMCQLQDAGGNWEDFRDLQYDVRDPYADHRKSTDE